MGILQPGSVSATIGTSGVVFAATASKPTKDPKGRLHTFCHAVPGLWHVMGVTQSAGLSLRWLKETFFAGQSYDALTAARGQGSRGSEGLEWAPYLLGERTPHLDPEVRAAFAGIGANHTAAHFVRAVLEGVAYSLKTRSRCSPSWAFRSAASGWAAAARAAAVAARFRRASTATRSKCSRPKRAARLAAR
jgi:xylulokinase